MEFTKKSGKSGSFLLVDFSGLYDIVIFQQKYRGRYLKKATEFSRKEEDYYGTL